MICDFNQSVDENCPLVPFRVSVLRGNSKKTRGLF